MNKNGLSKDDIYDLAEKKLKDCLELIKKEESRLKNNTEHVGETVFCQKRNNGYQYYFSRPDNKREYVKKTDINIVKRIVQRDYDENTLKALEKNKRTLERFLLNYDPEVPDSIYTNMCNGRKAIVVPLYPTDEQYITEWYKSISDNMNSYPNEVRYQTVRGEFVRSKSEKIIADLLEKMSIPYRYEPRLELFNGKSVFPDFAILSVKQRKTVYWEHFGLIDDAEYATKALKKMEMYDENRMIVGKDIFYSFESAGKPLNIKLIEAKIRQIAK